MSANVNVSSRLETNTAFIKDLIGDIRKGEIKIPQFQRKFVWKEEQALNLLDSISNSYPVGSILLWRTPTKLAIERNIGDFKLPKTDDLSPTNYVLDGQQRITVVYSCLGAPPEESGFAAGFDLDEEEFVQLPVEGESRVFPMRWVFDTTRLLNFRTGLQALPKAAQYQQRLDSIIAAFTSYRLPVVILKELAVEEVCPIFERINSAGTKLSMFDLMVAATWSPRFDLNDLAERLAESLETKGFDSIEPNTILKCLSSVKFKSLKRDQLLALRNVPESEMDSLVEQTQHALLRAVDLLSTEFKVYSWDFLPYEAVLIILCFVCSRLRQFESKQMERIRRWFWRSAFSERYRVGGEGFVTRDFDAVLKFVNEGAATDDFGLPLSSNHVIQTTFRTNNSRSRAFILALAAAKPRNLTNGAAIDVADALSIFNKKQFHHIYPRGYLKEEGEKGEPNSLANICMLAASENNLISDSDPHKYIPKLLSARPSDGEAVLASNFLPKAAEFKYESATFGDFLDARAQLLARFISELCEGKAHR